LEVILNKQYPLKQYLAILPFFIIGCSGKKEYKQLSPDEKQRIIAGITVTLNNYYKDIQEKGLMAELNYLDHSPDFFWVPPGYATAISYDSVIAVLQKNAPAYKKINNSWESLQVIPHSSSIAAYTGVIHSSMIDTAEKLVEIKLVETGFLINRSGSWKLLCGQTAISGE
jgi:hypothetical protein